MDWKRRLLVAAVASLAATAAIAIGILLFGDFGSTEARILGTTAAISFFSLLALPAGVLLERRAAEALAWLSLALVALAFVLVLAWIWSSGNSDGVARAAGAVTAYAVAVAQVAALTSRRRDSDTGAVRIVFLGACVLALLLATMAAYAIFGDVDDESFYRVLAALAVLDVFLVVLQPFLRRLAGGTATKTRIVLEGTEEQIEAALARIEGTGVSVRR